MVDSKSSWQEYFRLLTPFLLLVMTGLGTSINTRLNDIDQKLFHHLTNDEMHTPRSLVVEKVEYMAIQKMRDQQFVQICDDLRYIKAALNEHMKENIRGEYGRPTTGN